MPLPAAEAQTLRIAVLDFENLTSDPAVEWLGTGIAETVTADLRKLPGISITSRERVFEARGTQSGDDSVHLALNVGQELGVDLLVRGGFQRLGESIRITGHILDTAAGTVRGSVKLDGTLEEIFKLQDRVLASLLESAQLDLTDSDLERIARPDTVALQAYECYAKAKQKILHMGAKAFEEAEELLLEALDLDPDYAMAWATLGQIRAMRYIATTDPRDLEEGLERLSRAVELDPELGEPYAWMAYSFARRDRFEEAIAAGKRAVELDQGNPLSHYFCGVAHWLRAASNYVAGDWEVVSRLMDRVIKLMPAYQPALMVRADVRLRIGRRGGARQDLEQAVALELSDRSEAAKFVGSLTHLALLELEENDLDGGERRLRESLARLETSEHVYAPQFHSVTLYGLGQAAEARGGLERAAGFYREALSRGERHPRALGMGRVLARTGFALARALCRSGRPEEAAVAAHRAETLLTGRERFDFSGIWWATDMDILLEQARWLEAAGWTEDVAAVRERAREKGWIESSPT